MGGGCSMTILKLLGKAVWLHKWLLHCHTRITLGNWYWKVSLNSIYKPHQVKAPNCRQHLSFLILFSASVFTQYVSIRDKLIGTALCSCHDCPKQKAFVVHIILIFLKKRNKHEVRCILRHQVCASISTVSLFIVLWSELISFFFFFVLFFLKFC